MGLTSILTDVLMPLDIGYRYHIMQVICVACIVSYLATMRQVDMLNQHTCRFDITNTAENYLRMFNVASVGPSIGRQSAKQKVPESTHRCLVACDKSALSWGKRVGRQLDSKPHMH